MGRPRLLVAIGSRIEAALWAGCVSTVGIGLLEVYSNPLWEWLKVS